jgi:hypothetical protein
MRAPRKRTTTPAPLPPLAADEKSAADLGHDDEVFEFITAIDAYKRRQGRQFPSWSEVLGILKELGYKKDKQPT